MDVAKPRAKPSSQNYRTKLDSRSSVNVFNITTFLFFSTLVHSNLLNIWAFTIKLGYILYCIIVFVKHCF